MIISFNEEKNGIEVRFDAKPDAAVLEGLKANGFRWSKPQKLWYARRSDERIAYLRSLDGGDIEAPCGGTPQERPVFDLWTITRTDDIPDFYAAEHLHDNKEIAKRVRDHIKARFPMCKISVTKQDFAGGGSIDGRIKSAPWAKDSDEMKSILRYCDTYLNAYNYDNSDSYSDYWDVNFYESFQISYDYEQTAYNDADRISEAFRQQKAEAEEKERIEYERRCAEDEEQRKIDAERCRIAEEERNKAIAILEGRKVVKSVDYWVTNALDCTIKCSSIDEVRDEISGYDECRRNVHIKHDVYLNDEDYETISKNLMSDYSFCSGHGGTGTDDYRVNSFDDFAKMTKAERESVEVYIEDAIAVYRNDELMFLANPEGYGYIRYALILDDKSKVVDDYKGATGISEEEAEEYARAADVLVGGYNEIGDDCDADALRKWCHDNNFKLSPEIIRSLPAGAIKSCAYDAYFTIPPIQEQFKAADLKYGQKITIVRGGVFCMPSVILATVDHVEYKRYAQYEDSVSLVIKPKGKRSLYVSRFYSADGVVYDGWLDDLPRTLFFDIKRDGTTGMVSQDSKFMSFDKGILETALNYYGEQGHEPIVNTVNNRF